MQQASCNLSQLEHDIERKFDLNTWVWKKSNKAANDRLYGKYHLSARKVCDVKKQILAHMDHLIMPAAERQSTALPTS